MIGRITSPPDPVDEPGAGEAVGEAVALGDAVDSGVELGSAVGLGSALELGNVFVGGGAITRNCQIFRSMSPSSADFVVDLTV
jgi:hypothetical protein